jgi:hypothetical protein
MALQTSSIAVTPVTPITQRREVVRRESVRDFVGVAVGVATTALVWATFLALIRLPS